jgi:6-phospho-beta-glucosidase
MKIAVIGGGSTYTPELVSGLSRERDKIGVRQLVLHDIDAERREIVGGLAARMLRRVGWAGTLTLTGDVDEALDGASFVLVQLRVGGQAARLSDESLPLRFGTIGQETTGAGGIAKALRTVPVVLDLAERARLRALPGAWIVDFTNPVGTVTQALVDAGHRAIGLCNVAITLQRRLAAHLGIEPDGLALEHVGLNHLSWITGARTNGVDRLGEVLAEHGDDIATELHLPLDIINRVKAVPSYYLRYYYTFDDVLAEQRGGYRRAEEVMELERRLLEMYADPTLDTKPALLNDRDGAHPLPQGPMDPGMLELVRAVKAAERLAIRAALSGDPEDLRRTLEAHPLVGPRIGDVRPLRDALLEANREHLPRFAAVQ